MTSNPNSTKPKQTVGIFSKNSGKHTTTKESFPSKLKIILVFSEKINRFLNSGKIVSVTDIRRKYS